MELRPHIDERTFYDIQLPLIFTAANAFHADRRRFDALEGWEEFIAEAKVYIKDEDSQIQQLDAVEGNPETMEEVDAPVAGPSRGIGRLRVLHRGTNARERSRRKVGRTGGLTDESTLIVFADSPFFVFARFSARLHIRRYKTARVRGFKNRGGNRRRRR